MSAESKRNFAGYKKMRRKILLGGAVLLFAVTLSLMRSRLESDVGEISIDPGLAVRLNQNAIENYQPPTNRPAGTPVTAGELAVAIPLPLPLPGFSGLRACLNLNQAVAYFSAHPERMDSSDADPLVPAEPGYPRTVALIQKAEAEKFRKTIRDQSLKRCPEPAAFDSGAAYGVALAAARSGDKEAARCYAFAQLPGSEAILADPVAAGHFRLNARQLIEEGLREGDWGMVQIGRYSENLRLRGLLRTVGGDASQGEYRYAMLQFLGSTDATLRKDGEAQLEILSQDLTPQKKAAAEAWARQVYRASFATKPPYTRDVHTCTI